MINFKIGILGTGSIAEKIAETIAQLDSFEVYAVGSRDAARAAEFAAKYDIKKSYGSYDELVNDPDVELVYIATPHQCHADNAVLAINAGKPVLVEKPFSYNSKTAQDVIALAREKNVFCGEAMWLRFMPITKLLMKTLSEKVIGEVRYINATLCYDLRNKERLLKPEYAGGALLDIGVYPLTAIFLAMNAMPVAAASSCVRLATGIDAVDTISLNFTNGRAATCFVSMTYASDNKCIIYGTEGRIEIDNINCPEEMRVYNFKNDVMTKANPSERQINGYEYEFIAARDAIITGKLECPEMSHKDTITVLNFCDMLRRSWKVFYPLPGEDTVQNPPKPPVKPMPNGPAPTQNA
ncbi:MAG: Gfo/Idh/MocA family oxidoreductase [Eubacterium sp.]|nr:Gfo/Idh/MocA family oxidoreductase [Eubacterium sp.]